MLGAASALVNTPRTCTVDSASRRDYPSLVATVADRIREVLARTGWSQRELSRRAGLSPAAIGWILSHADRTTELDTIQKIAGAAGVSQSWLATGRGSPDDDAQVHPPDEIDVAGRRPVAQDAARTSRPTFENLPDWQELIAGARAMQAERGREIPEWAFAAVATSSALLTAPPSAATIYDLARVYADHGIGKPRPPRAETGVVKVKTEEG